MTTQKKFYIAELDSLRFFAFLLVFFHHFTNPRSLWAFFGEETKAYLVISKLAQFGWCGVDLFLVLSSFLITNLLLLEYEKNNSISLINFYTRRALRIWPLYYLFVIFGFFVHPYITDSAFNSNHIQLLKNHLLPYLLFFGNISSGFFSYPKSSFLAHLWTISLEEQFYIFWPLIMATSLRSIRHLKIILIFLCVFSVLARVAGVFSDLTHPIIWVNILTRMDPLALGALLAIHRKDYLPNKRLAPLKAIVGYSMLLLVTFFPTIETHSVHNVWQYLLIALGFTLIVDSITSGSKSYHTAFFRLPLFAYLGRLCYGLYVYHYICINFGTKIYRSLNLGIHGGYSYTVSFLITLALTIAFSEISYRLFEKKFLILKGRFTAIESGHGKTGPITSFNNKTKCQNGIA